jgi:hypothetical protein
MDELAAMIDDDDLRHLIYEDHEDCVEEVETIVKKQDKKQDKIHKLNQDTQTVSNASSHMPDRLRGNFSPTKRSARI